VEPCRANLGSNPRLHCVQASLYELPFRDGQFDYVYCIGVIQHTLDPKKSVESLLDKVAVGGSVGLWIYELTWKSFVGTMAFKNFLRPWTKRWSITRLERFSDRVNAGKRPVLRWPVIAHLGESRHAPAPAASAHIQAVPLNDADFRECPARYVRHVFAGARPCADISPRKILAGAAGFRRIRAIRTARFRLPARDYANETPSPKNRSAQTSKATIAYNLRAKLRRPDRCCRTASSIGWGWNKPRC
jgi:hypothetical protein